ncbi:MAG: sulfite reductase, ferredoxin dependent, partial [Nostocales cyanobacterium]
NHDDIESFLEPIFIYFKKFRKGKEKFGDFCDRVGLEAIREFSATYTPGTPTSSGKSRHRVSLKDDVYNKLKETAEQQGKPMTELVNEALDKYFQSL